VVLTACEHTAWFDDTSNICPGRRAMWLNGAGRGLSQFVRGFAVLHGSAIAFNGVGVTIVGPAKAGKSSLAAWLCQRDWRFISDAMTVVHPISRILQSQVGRFRLHDDSLRALGESPMAVPLDDEVTGKRRWNVPEGRISPPDTTLSHVVVLERSDELYIEELSSSDSVLMLVRHAYLASCIDKTESGRLLSLGVALVQGGVRVHLLRYPRMWNAMADAQSAIEALLNPTA
jgi:hypothetical protein